MTSKETNEDISSEDIGRQMEMFIKKVRKECRKTVLDEVVQFATKHQEEFYKVICRRLIDRLKTKSSTWRLHILYLISSLARKAGKGYAVRFEKILENGIEIITGIRNKGDQETESYEKMTKYELERVHRLCSSWKKEHVFSHAFRVDFADRIKEAIRKHPETAGQKATSTQNAKHVKAEGGERMPLKRTSSDLEKKTLLQCLEDCRPRNPMKIDTGEFEVLDNHYRKPCEHDLTLCLLDIMNGDTKRKYEMQELLEFIEENREVDLPPGGKIEVWNVPPNKKRRSHKRDHDVAKGTPCKQEWIAKRLYLELELDFLGNITSHGRSHDLDQYLIKEIRKHFMQKYQINFDSRSIQIRSYKSAVGYGRECYMAKIGINLDLDQIENRKTYRLLGNACYDMHNINGVENRLTLVHEEDVSKGRRYSHDNHKDKSLRQGLYSRNDYNNGHPFNTHSKKEAYQTINYSDNFL